MRYRCGGPKRLRTPGDPNQVAFGIGEVAHHQLRAQVYLALGAATGPSQSPTRLEWLAVVRK